MSYFRFILSCLVLMVGAPLIIEGASWLGVRFGQRPIVVPLKSIFTFLMILRTMWIVQQPWLAVPDKGSPFYRYLGTVIVIEILGFSCLLSLRALGAPLELQVILSTLWVPPIMACYAWWVNRTAKESLKAPAQAP